MTAQRPNFEMRIVDSLTTRITSSLGGICLAVALLACVCLAHPPQQPGIATIGQVTGGDISVIGQAQGTILGGTHSYEFAAGSTVVVHSGQARVNFTGGGELSICGPAKFTVLASGEALTIALNFGRVHAKLDASRPLTIYTPLITATLLAVMSEPRDVTIGLEPETGALCVLAAHGAVQVQQQLTGQALIIPEPSEVLLSTTPLVVNPASAGSCRCDFDQNNAPATLDDHIVAEKALPAEVTPAPLAKPAAASQSGAPATPAPQPARSGAAAKADQPTNASTPVPNAPKTTESASRALPPATGPILKIVAPPLVYNANSADSATETLSVATVLLARAVVVEPEWTFRGVVAEPAKNAHSAIPSQVATQQNSKEKSKHAQVKTAKRKGFWGWFHRFLFGSPAKQT